VHTVAVGRSWKLNAVCAVQRCAVAMCAATPSVTNDACFQLLQPLQPVHSGMAQSLHTDSETDLPTPSTSVCGKKLFFENLHFAFVLQTTTKASVNIYIARFPAEMFVYICSLVVICKPHTHSKALSS